MKRIFLVITITAAFFSFGCENHHSSNTYFLQSKENSVPRAKVDFLNEGRFNFGRLSVGDTLAYAFKIRNIGEVPLIINAADPSCGCTIASFAKKPILPTLSDSIVIRFVPTIDQKGLIHKTITIDSNADTSPNLLVLHGEVI
ncbi:DUF1573 domain-containing protein [Sphingobacterium oryzagri]|uniref:DUF1573 domain-containing protein n=1 Tax=Sphingobacterium oryzagri TaxID=3025669 RepID=A0ABY7WJE4_9SPHI|nr:DUF1573 domain-containing protein [Sphingobacterium sp. KACC 22765]WDF69709.1 DUF1573 domain-containing protein [Sphingobacterium sp. KACC 22765]